MKLKEGLVLREVAGQYVIVPTGAAVREVTDIVYISASAAYLWNYMANHEFEKEDLVEQGIHTQVRERGRRFSEGQKQRLSIARALLADAPVMILDEATSALDVGTERRVLRSIIKKEDRRTVIVAAHRPSVFALCSRVYKIEDHRMSEVDEKGLMDFLDRF